MYNLGQSFFWVHGVEEHIISLKEPSFLLGA